ncbi:MAG: tryptophan 7-halogenase [Paraburkholderia sp.]|jgi:flavin-dependent dehydrogenase|uniref:NAD(P)/FAD-dependent oxidoreductase n=1 Tax=Burkholderiaceae TaxID=119060 RepID=UPI0010FA40FF|nr:tryptophan 7-halogenase [Burkholderia sp. 4M9327F10]
METGHYDTDVAIIGGGPAGSAAAIGCASQGLRVRVFERERFAAERPGETLHPGIEPLLTQLGIDSERLATVVGARHTGIWVAWNGIRRFDAFGSDTHGAWRGFQVRRTAFDALLLERASELGVAVSQPCAVSGLLTQGDTVRGVLSAAGPVTARTVIDASGRAQWLCRHQQISKTTASPRLIARYGYAAGAWPERDDAPHMTGDATGWLWTAKVWPGTYQWTRVALDGTTIPADWMPAEMRHLTPNGPSRGADVTWRVAGEVAGPGWFMVGDAAAVLDPTSSHGVLKALLSGRTAAQLVGAILSGAAPPREATEVYRDWLSGWFDNDAAQMARFYAGLGVEGFG